MAITAAKIIRKIEEFYPRSLAESWDNPGLLAGRGDREVHTVVIALDVSRRVVDLAVREHADLILSHHPLIFGSIKSVNDETFLGRKLLDLIENKISCYAMHTNFDIARNGMAYIAAEQLGLADFTPLEVTGEQDGETVGIGFVGDVTPAMMQRAEHLKDMKNTGFVSVRGSARLALVFLRAMPPLPRIITARSIVLTVPTLRGGNLTRAFSRPGSWLR